MARRTWNRLVLVTLLLLAVVLFFYQHTKNTQQDVGADNVRVNSVIHDEIAAEDLLVNKHRLLSVPLEESNDSQRNSLKQESMFNQPQEYNIPVNGKQLNSEPEAISNPTTSANSTLQSSPCASIVATCNDHENHTSCIRRGFALSLSFWDQQTWACGNLFGLQCWASNLKMAVVEPFLINTKLGFPSRPIEPTDLPLSKLYNMDHWNEYSSKKGNAPTVTWECFVHAAPKNLILVYLKGYAGKCNHDQQEADSKLIISLGFQIVKKVCISAKVGHRLSIPEFNQKVLGEFSPTKVTVIFQQWSQNTIGDVLDMDEAHFPMALARSLPLAPSKWIKKDADEYISRYLGKNYVAVLLRMEWVSMYARESVYNQTLLKCLNDTQFYVRLARSVAGTSTVFLGMDIGQYGSVTYKSRNSEIVQDAIEKYLFHSVYPDQEATISKWEQTFAEVSQYNTPGYIALLQKSIAVQSTCLLLMGSGSFHKQALDEYLSFHSKKAHQCYFTTDSHCEKFKSVKLSRS